MNTSLFPGADAVKLSVLLDIVKKTAPSEWLLLERFGCGRAAFHASYFGAEPDQGRLAVCRENLDIALFIAAVDQNDVLDPEDFDFGDAIKQTLVVQLGYRGLPVYEWVFLLLGPDDLLIPMPVAIGRRLEFEKEELPFAMLAAALLGAAPADAFQLRRLRLHNVMAV
jgi:hypothetical protein